MLSPAVMFIEMAAEGIKKVPEWIRESQQKELSSFGDGRAQQIGATGLTDDFRKGYELGLQTARSVLAMSGTLITKGVNPSDAL